MPRPDWRPGLAALAGTIAGWWIYVPVHELMHVFGCVSLGGTVYRLEISPEYGAALLRKLFPFISVGSDYAGQLVGFDTGGNDWIYLSTVFAPYLFTIFTGVPILLEIARRARPGPRSSALLGAIVPCAFASLANVAGDYYELGSIPVSRLVALLSPGADPARWRSDDLVLLSRELVAQGGLGATDAFVLIAGFVLGVAAAYVTYWLGVQFHRLIARSASE